MAKAKKSREGAVMVLGGGIAGVQAALDLTDLGYYVYLDLPDQRLFALNPGAQVG
jgi:heterodisulfide reductase subunit A-like polyferredoxin